MVPRKKLRERNVKPFNKKDLQRITEVIDSWYLYNRPSVQWWRIPNLDKIRDRVVKILDEKMGLIVVDGLSAQVKMFEDRASSDKKTSLHYAGLYDFGYELVLRFAKLEKENRAKAVEVRKTLEKVRANGIPESIRGYIPDITIDVV